MSERPVLIVTAGHIDHGKSTLVKALTGTDPDRLEEEKQRGMTIDLGFASLTENIAFVDVPGHERFIKNMVAGIAPIAVAMLVVAADDGVMPQTREHLAILQLLGLKSGLIVINKIDLVAEDWLELVVSEVHQLVQESFLAAAPLFKVSAANGTGILDLKNYILQLSKNFAPEPPWHDVFCLPIDRVFSVKGYGTVVTGSVISGSAQVGDEIEIVPLGRRAIVRRLETHNQVVSQVSIGQRAAINLPGIERQDLRRGYTLATPGILPATRLLTVSITLLPEARQLEYNDLVHVHLGTGEYLAHVRWIGRNALKGGESGIAQLVFDELIAAGFRERFIIRAYSPKQTIGGGQVLENNPRVVRKKEAAYASRLLELSQAPLTDWLVFFLEKNAQRLVSATELARQFTCTIPNIHQELMPLLKGQVILAWQENYQLTSRIEQLKLQIEDLLTTWHAQYPLLPAIDKAKILKALSLEPQLGHLLLEQMIQQRRLKSIAEGYALPNFSPRLNATQQNLMQQIETALQAAALQPPTISELATALKINSDLLQALVNLLVLQEKIIIVEKMFPFTTQAVARAQDAITQFLRNKAQATVSELKEVLGVSRKYAVPLLNYFDQIGLTRRSGDWRLLKEV